MNNTIKIMTHFNTMHKTKYSCENSIVKYVHLNSAKHIRTLENDTNGKCKRVATN